MVRKLGLDWLKARCPECGGTYLYLGACKPPTCNKFQCVFRHLHPEIYGKGGSREKNNISKGELLNYWKKEDK